MLHAPTTESKQQNDRSRSQSTTEWDQELSPRVPVLAGYAHSGAAAGVPPASPFSGQPPLSFLHSIYGNQAVLRMLSSSKPTIQTKLKVNQPGDQYEQEADRVAEQVMRMPEPARATAGAGNVLQRKCADCTEEEEKVGRPVKLSRKASGGAAALDGTAPPIVHEVLHSSGQPLEFRRGGGWRGRMVGYM